MNNRLNVKAIEESLLTPRDFEPLFNNLALAMQQLHRAVAERKAKELINSRVNYKKKGGIEYGRDKHPGI